MKKKSGYIPPPHYQFESTVEAIGFMASSVCSLECSRFLSYINAHPKRKDRSVGRFLSAYTLSEWASGKIPSEVYLGREAGARESLRQWAASMIELNSWFRNHGVNHPIVFMEEQGLISESSSGWKMNKDKMRDFIKQYSSDDS